MKVLIFGSGQDAIYLEKEVMSSGGKVKKVSRSTRTEKCDVGDSAQVEAFISDYRPDAIIHLAAISSTSTVYNFENFQAIVLGTKNILDSVIKLNKDIKVFIAGSALQFEPSNNPIQECDELISDNIYSSYRNISLEITRIYRKLYSLKIYYAFLYHHDSPLRSNEHIAIKIVDLLINAKNQGVSQIEINDFESMKEFGHASDVARNIIDFISQDEVFEVNICTGILYKLDDWAKICGGLLGLEVAHKSKSPGIGIGKYYRGDITLMKKIGLKNNYNIFQLAEEVVTARLKVMKSTSSD